MAEKKAERATVEPKVEAAPRPPTPGEIARTEHEMVRANRLRRIEEHTKLSQEWAKTTAVPISDEKPTIPIVIQTPKDRPLKVRGREFKSMEQTLANKQQLRILVGLSRRNVCQLIIGKIKLPTKE